MGELTTEPAEYVKIDLFPCTVRGPEKVYGPEARVILTDNHLYVFMDAPRGPEMVAKAPVGTEYTGSLTAGYQIGEYFVTKDTSCGCGSRLRSFYPFIGLPFRQAK